MLSIALVFSLSLQWPHEGRQVEMAEAPRALRNLRIEVNLQNRHVHVDVAVLDVAVLDVAMELVMEEQFARVRYQGVDVSPPLVLHWMALHGAKPRAIRIPHPLLGRRGAVTQADASAAVEALSHLTFSTTQSSPHG